MTTLLAVMARLRTPDGGCPWDSAQTHASLVPFVIEEAYEVADAIQRGSSAELRNELGDLLFQVVFHAQIASEAGVFAFADVVQALCEKMIRRHPHVFAKSDEANQTGAAEVVAGWERIKAAERGADGRARRVLDDVPLALPGLTRAVKLQKKASRVSFDWGDPRLVLAKIREEIDEIAEALDAEDCERRAAAVTDEIGDLLFTVANLARHSGVDPESAVRGTNAKFERRFAYVEDHLAERGSTPGTSSLEVMDGLWDEAKAAGL